MSQTWSDNVPQASNDWDSDLSTMKAMFAALKSNFSGASAPSNAIAGQLWLDTTNNILKIYTGSAWQEIWDYGNNRIASGRVMSDSLASEAVTAGKLADGAVDATARIADAIITAAKLAANTVHLGKIQIGTVALPIASGPKETEWSTTSTTWEEIFNRRIYIPDNADKIQMSCRIKTSAAGGEARCRFYLDSDTYASDYISRTGTVYNWKEGTAYSVDASLKGAWTNIVIQLKTTDSAYTAYCKGFTLIWTS